MQYKTVILTSDNWAVGTSDNVDILLWSIKDKPWLNLRTFQLDDDTNLPYQLKSNSWTNVEIVKKSQVPDDVQILHKLISTRIALFKELTFRLQNHKQLMGVSDVSTMLVGMFEYLAQKKIVQGSHRDDSDLQWENSIKLLQDLERIKISSIEKILQVRDKLTYDEAKNHMDRMFFTNILL